MATYSASAPPSAPADGGGRSSSSLRTFRISLPLARKMRADLGPHIKDRKWRLKSYERCFKASHALAWALNNIDAEEGAAVDGLNDLVEYGLVTHVVDPSKRFRVGETSTLYFRMCDAILDAELTSEEVDGLESEMRARFKFSSSGRGPRLTLLNGEVGSRMSVVRGNGMFNASADAPPQDIQQRLDDIDHVLQQTVKELKYTRGKLEVVHQEVLGLVSQQISTFVVIFLIYLYTIIFLVPWSSTSWAGLLGLAVMVAVSSLHSYRCISLWSDLDSQATDPLETIAVPDDEGSTAEGSVIRTAKSFGMTPNKSLISNVVSKSLRSLKGVPGRATRSASGGKEKPKVFMRDAYSLPDVGAWPHHPLLICVNSAASPRLEVPGYGLGPCPLGVPFKFSSELFEGTCLVRLKGSDSDDREGDAAYFAGRKRTFQSVVQGRFKEEVPASDVVTGHEFVRPLRNLPHPFVLRTATNFIRKVSPGADIVVHEDRPYMEAPLAGTSQAVRGDAPGNEPDITTRDIMEDCSVLGGPFESGKMSASRRKRLFSNPAKSKGYTFDSETVYTFEFYQNLFDAKTYSLDLGFAKFGCDGVLNGQPIQWLGKMRDGRYLWSFQIWHEKLLDRAKPHDKQL